MTTTLSTKKAHITDAFQERLDRKMAKLDKFFGDDAKAAVMVSIHKDMATVEVTITSKGFLFRSEKTAPDMNDALEAVTDAVTTQIIRNRKRLQDKWKGVHTLTHDEGTPVVADHEHEEDYQVVKTKTFPVRFMNVEEAILQMNLLGHTFFMYRNDVSREINVVYKRKDGHYGLIETV